MSPTLTQSLDREKEKEKDGPPFKLSKLKTYLESFANDRKGCSLLSYNNHPGKAKSEEGSKSGTFNIFRGIQDKRKQKKNNLYRLLFNLPETETLLFGESIVILFSYQQTSDYLSFNEIDVVASYVKRGNPLLIDGRLYVSQKYICFFSNIFGIKTTEVIALDEVVSIDQNADGLNAGVAITTKNNSVCSFNCEHLCFPSSNIALSHCQYYFALTFGSSKTKVYEHLMSVWKREAISDSDRATELNDAIATGEGGEEVRRKKQNELQKLN